MVYLCFRMLCLGMSRVYLSFKSRFASLNRTDKSIRVVRGSCPILFKGPYCSKQFPDWDRANVFVLARRIPIDLPR